MEECILLLHENQIEAFHRANKILDLGNCYINVSDRGRGKTNHTCIVARSRGLALGIVTTKTMIPKWRQVAEYCGTEIAFIINYEMLCGRNNTCNNDLLTKIGDKFETTPKLNNLLNLGILVAFDESHMAKNKNVLRHKASITISLACRDTPSKIVLLSASLFEKEILAESVPRMLGILSKEELISYDKQLCKYVQEGIAELIAYCRSLDPELTKTLVPNIINHINIQNVYSSLIIRVLMPNLRVVIERNEKSTNKVYMENRLYDVSKEELTRLREAEQRLNRARFACIANGNMKLLASAQSLYDQVSEEIKLPTIANEVIRLIEDDPDLKFIIFVWRHESVGKLKNMLFNFLTHIGILNGNLDSAKRQQVIENFGADNDEMSILIACPSVCTGISLDDIYGGRRRVIFAIPNKKFSDLYQALGRSDRDTTVSDTYITVVYIDGVKAEQSYIDNLDTKRKVLQRANGYEIMMPRELIRNCYSKLIIE